VPEQQITIPAEEITPPADVASVVKLDDTCMFFFLLFLIFICVVIVVSSILANYLFFYYFLLASEQPKAMEATTPPIPSRDAEDHLGENVSPQHPTNTCHFCLSKFFFHFHCSCLLIRKVLFR
jgi:hypothetical protein